MRSGANGTSTKRGETAARIIKALGESSGLLTVAAQKAGIGYRTICRYVAEFPSVKLAAQEAHERMLDFAESKLYQNIKEGDNACIIFYLKTQGKSRGYIERQEVEHSGNIEVGAEDFTDAELVAVIEGRSCHRTVKAPVGPQSSN